MELTALTITVLSNILLGTFVFYRNPKSATNRIFALLNYVIVAWSIANYISLHPPTPESTLFWIRMVIFWATPLTVSFFLLVHTFPADKIQLSRNRFRIILIAMVLTMVVSISPYLFTDLSVSGSTVTPVPGPGILLFIITGISSIFFGILVLVRKFRKSVGLSRLQLKYMLLGVTVMFTLILTTVFFPVIFFQETRFVAVSPLYTLPFMSTVAYAIIRHRLLNIGLVVARAVAYTLLVTIIGVFYTASTVIATSLFLETTANTTHTLLYTILTLVVAFSFQPLLRLLERVTDKIFFKNPYVPEVLLAELTRIMARTLLLDQLSMLLLHKLTKEMKITRGAFVLLDKGKIFDIESIGFDQKLALTDSQVFSLQSPNQILVLENLPEGNLRDLFRSLKITIATPLKTGNEEIGLLLLGEKASGEIYSDQDFDVLSIFSTEVSVAVQNAKSYEEIRRFNITLKEEVERATKELKVANERLRELDKLKDEFISVTSHDLRTPLTAIKSYLWLALHGKAGKVNEKMEFYLGRSYQSAERMLALITDLLDVSRIERGKIELNLEPADLGKVLDMVLDELQSKAIEKSIKLTLKMPKTVVPEVMLDQERFPEIVTNLVGNALKFTPDKGSITINVQPKKDMVEVSVIDSGVGISKEDMPKLFSKFGRLDSSYKAVAATGGTGLGLYITKSLVQLHGGEVGVVSQVGRGTTFTFTLRVATEEEKKKKKYVPAPQGVIINPELMGNFKPN